MNDKDKKELVSQSTDIALSGVGSLVGFAIGGPVGAIAGGVIAPTTKLAIKAGELWVEWCRRRLENIVNTAVIHSGKNSNDIFQEMIDSPEWCNTIISMIRHLMDSDPELDVLFSEIMASAIGANDDNERNRMVVLSDSIIGLNKIQILILKHIYLSNGILSACAMAEKVNVPELELRNAVRDLELRGMIMDNGEEPTIWILRELGIAIAKTIESIDFEEEKQ